MSTAILLIVWTVPSATAETFTPGPRLSSEVTPTEQKNPKAFRHIE